MSGQVKGNGARFKNNVKISERHGAGEWLAERVLLAVVLPLGLWVASTAFTLLVVPVVYWLVYGRKAADHERSFKP